MKYVIIRDDDTNALTPVSYLERLYRPFLDAGLPVSLATIPNVKTEVYLPTGEPEGFLVAKNGVKKASVPLAENQELVSYLKSNPLYHIVQHGYHHEFVNKLCEFDHNDRADIARRLDEGTRHLQEAGFAKPATFVAPYDRMTRTSFEEISRRFPVISTGWFELGRMPYSWLPAYAVKKARGHFHWRPGKSYLLSHPGCHLSYHRPYGDILARIKKSIDERQLTVLVTHWWEFFRANVPDEAFIQVLHETAEYLASRKDIKVIRFGDIATGDLQLN